MASDGPKLAVPDRVIYRPVIWALDSGWLDTGVEVLTVADDAAASSALSEGRASVALLDPVYWARHFQAYRPAPPVALTLARTGTDLLLLSRVRLDALERATAPPSISGTAQEALARTLVRDFYGVWEALRLEERGRVEDAEGRVAAEVEALTSQPYEHVESLSAAWWLMQGVPLVRGLFVEPVKARPVDGVREALTGAARLMSEHAETAARDLSRRHGGEEERWLGLVNALALTYGPEERKALSLLLMAASRSRMCPHPRDIELPRY